jgi:hypothetical protein
VERRSGMADTGAVAVKEVLGVSPTDDGRQMLVGFQTAADQELVLALDADTVVDTLNDFLEATSIVPFEKGQANQGQHAFEVDAFELAKVQDSGDLALTLLRGKAHITFRLPAGMGEKVLENLQTIFAKPTPPAASTPTVAN